MSDRQDEEWLDGIIHQAVDLGKVEFDRHKWLDRLAAERQRPAPAGVGPGNTKPNNLGVIWRRIMESKVTRYSIAATIVVAAALILTNPFSFFGSSHGVVLAEVVERMNEVQTITHKEKRRYYEIGKDEPLLKVDVVKYLSSAHGVVEEQYSEAGSLLYRAYILKDPPQILIVLTEYKKYLKMPLADPWARLMEHLTPKAIVEHFKAGNCRDLGPARIDGHDVEGFETGGPQTFPIPEQYGSLFPIRDIKWQFWISKDLPFPVAADLEVTTGRSFFTLFKELRIVCHAYDMRYDQDIPSTVFEPNIPADFTPLNLESAVTENAAWLGVGALPIVGIVAHRRRWRRAGPRAPLTATE